MTPNLMRAIDFWVGIPLTLSPHRGATASSACLDSPARPPVGRATSCSSSSPRWGRWSWPTLRSEKRASCFRTPRCTSSASRRFGRAWRCSRSSHPRTSSRSTRAPVASLVRDTLAFPWRARRHGIDTVINMEAFVRYSSMLSYLSGARRRVGFHRFNQEGLYAGDLLTHKVLYNAHVHAAHTFLDLVHALDTPPDQVPRVKRPRAMDSLAVAEGHDRRASGGGHLAQAPCDQRRHRTRAQAGDSESQCERAVSHAPHAPRVVHRARAHTVGRSRGLRPDHGRRQRQAGRPTASAGRSNRHVRWT